MLNISPKLPPPRDIQTFFSISLEFHTKTRDIEIRTSADRSDWTVAPDSRVREKRVRVGRKLSGPPRSRNVGLRMPRHTPHGRRETPCPIREQYGELRMSGNAQTAGHSPELLLSDDIVQLRMPRHTGCTRGPEQCSSLSYISLRHIGIKVIAYHPQRRCGTRPPCP